MMKLGNEFTTARQNFMDAVATGAPMEEQNKLYNEMIEALTDKLQDDAREAARKEIENLNPVMYSTIEVTQKS